MNNVCARYAHNKYFNSVIMIDINIIAKITSTYKLWSELDVYMKAAANFHANNHFSQYMTLVIYFLLLWEEKKNIARSVNFPLNLATTAQPRPRFIGDTVRKRVPDRYRLKKWTRKSATRFFRKTSRFPWTL